MAEETLKERGDRLPARNSSREMRLSLPSPTSGVNGHLQTLNLITRLSPQNNGSNLYDSYELRAVIYQLNKAMQIPSGNGNGSSPANLCYLKSPFYSHCLNRVNRGNSRAVPKKVLCSHLTCATINSNPRNRRSQEVTRGFAAKLWNKVKQGLRIGISQEMRELGSTRRCN